MRIRRELVAICLIAGGWVLAGCAHPKDESQSEERVAPAYAELRDRVNARSERLQRLWARATVVVWTTVDGQKTKDQGDGILQVVQPTNLMLSIGKRDFVGFVLYLGSDGERYWWVDTVGGDEPVALVGRHELATMERSRELGVPVHPLDLVELLGVSGLPDAGPKPVWDSDDAGWSVTVPARFGQRRVVLDPVEWYPVRIELFDGEGQLAAESTLEDYKRLEEFDGEGLRPELASRITIDLASIEARVLFDFGAALSVDRKPRDMVFDFDLLLQRERVRDVRDLDEPES